MQRGTSRVVLVGLATAHSAPAAPCLQRGLVATPDTVLLTGEFSDGVPVVVAIV